MAAARVACTDCGGVEFVEQRSAGDVICKRCGLVAESHVIDERSEWRTFADKDKDSGDPSRVGAANNPLLGGNALSTVIQQTRGDGGLSYSLNRMHNRSNNPDRALVGAFKRVGGLCEQLNLGPAVKDGANEIYKNVSDAKACRGRSTQAIVAACVFLSSRQENNPRTFREITSVLPDVSKRDIGQTFKEVVELMKKQAEERKGTGEAAMDMARLSAPVSTHPADHLRRFCAQLSLDFPTLKVCREMAYKAKPAEDSGQPSVLRAWDGRSPLTLAAGILYIVTSLAKEAKNRVSMQQITIVTQVAEVTVQSVYRDLYPHLATLLPPNYATPQEVLAKLHVPDKAPNYELQLRQLAAKQQASAAQPTGPAGR